MRTLGKWKLSQQSNEWIVGDDGFAIAKVIDGKEGTFNKDNAEFIVQAVNSFDDMLEIEEGVKKTASTDEKKRFLAYKLLEWAGDCEDRVSFDKLPETEIINALREAENILAKLET